MDSTLKLLVINDDDVDRMQLKLALEAGEFAYELTEKDGLAFPGDLGALEKFDCIFLDYLLTGDNGLMMVKRIRESGVTTPVVIIASRGNESIAVELMKAGASDYVVKNDINAAALNKILRNMLAMREVVRERERAAQALRISEARLAQAQRIAKIGNWEYANATNTFYFSDQAYHTIDIPLKTPVTVDLFVSRIHPEDRDLALRSWREVLHGKVLNIDFRVQVSEGIRYLNSQGYAIADSQGNVEKIVGTLQDITERKTAEQEIMKARELAENSIKVKEIFLANMSHEIRTPMNAILGFTDLLYETKLTAEQRRYVDAIHFSGENLVVVINDILDLSKIRSGKMSIEKCDFDLHDLVHNVISVMSGKAREKRLRLIHTLDPEVPRHVNGDPVRLNQILTNLLSNAIKFTDEGGVTLTITPSTSENQNILVEFNVIDTGIGIAENMQSAIFENFVQASGDTARKYGGTGLGLTIVKNLVELQGGKLSLTSYPGRGSHFQVQLPLEDAGPQKTRRPLEPLSQYAVTETLNDVAVLVAEDNRINQLLVRKVLDKVGCRVDFASSGEEALECVRAGQYDVILMDIQMPGMDGYEATRKIRNEFPKPLSDIPIIAMTAHAFGSDVTRCLSAGMNDYISKPFKAPDLYARIAKYAKPEKSSKVVPLSPATQPQRDTVDLSTFQELGKNDAAFISELAMVYDKQTPVFIEKLKSSTARHNYSAIGAVCHQIKSSYGILKVPALDKVLRDLAETLPAEKSSVKMIKVSNLVETLIALISTINEQVQEGLKQTA